MVHPIIVESPGQVLILKTLWVLRGSRRGNQVALIIVVRRSPPRKLRQWFANLPWLWPLERVHFLIEAITCEVAPIMAVREHASLNLHSDGLACPLPPEQKHFSECCFAASKWLGGVLCELVVQCALNYVLEWRRPQAITWGIMRQIWRSLRRCKFMPRRNIEIRGLEIFR